MCLISTQDIRYLILPEFELDPDVLDEQALTQLEVDMAAPRISRPNGEQTMPLLVGLMDSAAARRSLDYGNGDSYEHDINIDLEDLAAKRTSGGSMVDSVANMANSILGAGVFSDIFSGCLY